MESEKKPVGRDMKNHIPAHRLVTDISIPVFRALSDTDPASKLLSDGNDLISNNTGNIGQPKVTTTEPVGQPIVLHPKQVKNRRVKIVNMHSILDRMVADLVSRAINEAGLDAATCHPDRVAIWVMIAPISTL
jgi:hypothetical protein